MNQTLQHTDKVNEWFDNLISEISKQKMLINDDIPGDELTDLFRDVISGDNEKLMMTSKDAAYSYFISNMLGLYLKKINNNYPKKLAFDLSNNKILVWAEIENSDSEELLDHLLSIEAEVNSVYFEKGFCISSTIVDSNDNLTVPDQYKVFN